MAQPWAVNDNATAAQYLTCSTAVVAAVAARAGHPPAVVAVVVALVGLRARGAKVSVADLADATGMHIVSCRRTVAALVGIGWAARGQRHTVDVTPAGRSACADVVRAWHRSANQLRRYLPAAPYVRPAKK